MLLSRTSTSKNLKMYSQDVTFGVEISGNHGFSDSHKAQPEVEGLEGARFQGKELTGKKLARLRTRETLTYQPSSLPEGPDQCVVRVSSRGVKVRFRSWLKSLR